MTRTLTSCLVLLFVLAGCGDDSDAPTPEPDRFDCDAFVAPMRSDRTNCDDIDASDPSRLVACTRGSGHLGQWVVDAAGLPAYDFNVEQRCDPVAQGYSPRPRPLRDPIHLIGNGRGLVAMAHASGGVEIYTQDRGHKWINRIDTWADPQDPEFPPQLGGGFSYYSVSEPGKPARVGSTRFEDLPVNRALQKQSRRFGVGYYETVTTEDDIVVHRRVFAPNHPARALISEVVVENPTATTLQYGLVELWDINLHQVSLELVTSDVAFPGVTDAIERRRRLLSGQFRQQATWNAERHVAVVTTQAKAPPAAAADRRSVSRIDYFPDPIYLAVLDDAQPDGVWLSDSELWADQVRTPPLAVAGPGNAVTRTLDIDGAGQHALLAVRIPIEVEPHGSATLRFAFGYVPGGGSPDVAVASLRAEAIRLRADAEESWRDRLVWAAFPDLPEAGVVQRELAWAAYSAIANTTYDEYRGVRLLGQGGSYKYIHGLDGAMGDLALFAEAMILVDPKIARDTLIYALATQLAGSEPTPWRFPYATTGVGAYSDVSIYDQRSDAYYFLPAAIGRYVALSRDTAFLTQDVAYYPRSRNEAGSVLDHIGHALDYGTQTLGFGARGLLAIGTGDYADGINSLATEPATPGGTSSTYNAGAVAYGFPLAADMVERFDAALAQRMRDLALSQAAALVDRAWEGSYFYRGFVDSGNPLAPHIFFLEPQLFPVLAGIVDPSRGNTALDEVVERLETGIGAVSNVVLGDDTTVGGPDQPLIGGIWPVANAWLTAAYARRNANEAWSSFTRNTLAAHAQAYPDLWYGIWTGPDSFNGPDSPRPGEADAHLVTALTDYPALNSHMHTSLLRALVDLVGVEGTRDGLRITPRVPTERFSVVWPRLSVRSMPTRIEGTYRSSCDGVMLMEVALPSGLRGKPVAVVVDGLEVPSTVESDVARFELATQSDEATAWLIEAAD